MIECLVWINAGLNAPAASGIIDERDRFTLSTDNHVAVPQTLPAVAPLRDPENQSLSASPPPQSGNVTRSPKARRILGISQQKSGGIGERSTSIMRRSETMSSLSTHLMKISPKSRKEPRNQSTDVPHRRSSLRSNLMRSNLMRTNSLSGSRNLITALIGEETGGRNEPKLEPGRAEKYLRGVLDVFRHTSGSPKKAERKSDRSQTRSAPAGRRLFAVPPVNPDETDHSNHAGLNKQTARRSFAMHEAALVSGIRLPRLHAEFSWEKGLNQSESFESSKTAERPLPSCDSEVQIREVILEYVYGTLRSWKGDDDDYGNGAGEPSDSPRVSSLVASLHRISFDTRFKVSFAFLPSLADIPTSM